MHRALPKVFVALLNAAIAMLFGCSVQNPYALFGPSRVPSPASAEISPYYPAGITAGAKGKADQAASSRPTISVSTISEPPVAIQARVADEEPIRIAENPAAAHSSSTPRTSTRSSLPNSTPPSTLQPPPPSTNPAGSFRSGSRVVSDPAVAPAAYQRAAPTMSESPPAAGQWRVRP